MRATFPETDSDLSSPFSLHDDAAYVAWREKKLAAMPDSIEDLQVDIADAGHISEAETAAVYRALGRANFAVYRFTGADFSDKKALQAFAAVFGLHRLDSNLCADEDSISSLQVVTRRRQGEYIPYTNKRLNWHTDGYYNTPEQQIRGVVLHCIRPAASGGVSAMLDHEIAYIQLRDENPAYIRALMQADAMTIPPNLHNGKEIRAEQSGPVFSVDSCGNLHMRYSARAKNIVWKDDSATQAATRALLNLFQDDSPYIFRHQLESGQGVISNNVLHCRTSFEDDAGSGATRLLYRARYFDRAVNFGEQ